MIELSGLPPFIFGVPQSIGATQFLYCVQYYTIAYFDSSSHDLPKLKDMRSQHEGPQQDARDDNVIRLSRSLNKGPLCFLVDNQILMCAAVDAIQMNAILNAHDGWSRVIFNILPGAAKRNICCLDDNGCVCDKLRPGFLPLRLRPCTDRVVMRVPIVKGVLVTRK